MTVWVFQHLKHLLEMYTLQIHLHVSDLRCHSKWLFSTVNYLWQLDISLQYCASTFDKYIENNSYYRNSITRFTFDNFAVYDKENYKLFHKKIKLVARKYQIFMIFSSYSSIFFFSDKNHAIYMKAFTLWCSMYWCIQNGSITRTQKHIPQSETNENKKFSTHKRRAKKNFYVRKLIV